MATRTTSVPLVDGPPADAPALDATLAELRRRFPGAILDRYLGRLPRLGRDVLLAAGAALAGEVILEDDVSIWYAAVLRGDLAPVTIGAGSNVQDGAVLHSDPDFPVTVGAHVSIGHRAVVHGCTVGDDCLIGMGATVLNHARIGRNCLIGAKALVTEGRVIPDNSLVIGMPGKISRQLSQAEVEGITTALGYAANWKRYVTGMTAVE